MSRPHRPQRSTQVRRQIKATRLDEGSCSICLIDKTEVDSRGKVNSCDHFFCFECILEWSKLNPSCPKCKEPFRLINKHYLDKASASVHSTGSPNRVIVKPIAAVRSPSDNDGDDDVGSYGDGRGSSFDDSNETETTDLDFIVDRGEQGPALAELMWREECHDRRQDDDDTAAAAAAATSAGSSDSYGGSDDSDGEAACDTDSRRAGCSGGNRRVNRRAADRHGSYSGDSDDEADDGDGEHSTESSGGAEDGAHGARGATTWPGVGGGLDSFGDEEIEEPGSETGAEIDFGRRWGSERARSMAAPARPAPRANPLELLMRGKENSLMPPGCHPRTSLPPTSLRPSGGGAGQGGGGGSRRERVDRRGGGRSRSSSIGRGGSGNGGQQPRKNGLNVKIVRRRKTSALDGKPGELIIDYAPTSGWLGGTAKKKKRKKEK